MLTGFQTQVPLAPQTTFKVGGVAEYYAEAHTVAELTMLSATARAANQPVTILGGGSNVLVADAGVAGCVIKNCLNDVSHEQRAEAVLLTAGAGCVFDAVVAETVANGWWGLENLSHIPGSVGATPIQNVGAYGVEVAERIHSVQALHLDTAEEKTFSAADCLFGYRDSYFKTPAGRRWAITHVTFVLRKTSQPMLEYRDLATRFAEQTPTAAEVRAAVIDIRAAKFPDWHTVGTAGSFFKNPIIPSAHYKQLQEQYPLLPCYPAQAGFVKIPLGWVLEHICHLRGVMVGSVGTYHGQALVLIQTGGATEAAVATFADQVVAQVAAATGITVEWEVTRLS